MKPLLLSLYLFFTGTATLCAQTELPKIYLNPKSNAVINQSQFVDSIQFIPLEQKKGIIAPPSSYIIVADKIIVLNDYNSSRLFIYTALGVFIKEVNYAKQAKDFSVFHDANKNQLILLGENKKYELTEKDLLQIKANWENPKNRKYFSKYIIDLNDASFTLQKVKPTKNDVSGSYPFFSDYYFQGEINTASLHKDSIDYQIKLYKDEEAVKKYFPYNAGDRQFLHSPQSTAFIRTDKPFINIVTRPFCDTIYKMLNDSIYPLSKIIVPLENAPPSSLFTTAFKNAMQRSTFNQNNAWVFNQVYFYHETEKLILISIRYLNQYAFYNYQKESQTTYKVQNIKADSSQYNLTLLNNYTHHVSGSRLFEIISASSIIDFFATNKTVAVPPELESFLKSDPSRNAAMIVTFKLKN